ncbi:MAG: SWEET family sugar transporter [Actinomycetota bacterium]|jgi:uncharacterized protein with PQ loop repeat|nr:hypothetical protein [Actinomycetota bacterium]MDQ3771239.1 SWEET family sugar transporter [Actinomycetota bacterium]
MVANALGIAAATWGIVMGLSPVLQIRKMVARRSSEDVSIGYFGVLLAGFALWICYGASIGNLVLIIPNTVALCVASATIAVARHYR